MSQEYDPEPFEQLLRKLIDTSGESYRQIAHSVGLDVSSISRYLKGQRPSQTACIALAVRFGISPNEMLRAAGYDPLPQLERQQIGSVELDDEIQRVAAKLQHVWSKYDGGAVLNAFGALVDAYLKAWRSSPRQMLQYVPAKKDLIHQLGFIGGRVFWEGDTCLLIPEMRLWKHADLAQWPDVDPIEGHDLFAAPSGMTSLRYELPMELNDDVADPQQAGDEVRRGMEMLWTDSIKPWQSPNIIDELAFPKTHLAAGWRERWQRFFDQQVTGASLLDTLAWFVFQVYGQARDVWTLERCPACGAESVQLDRHAMDAQGQFTCAECGGTIYLTDVLMRHPVAGTNPFWLMQSQVLAIKQMLLIHGLRLVLTDHPEWLEHLLIVQQGPLAFLEYPGPWSAPMQALVEFLLVHHRLYLIGLEPDDEPIYYVRQIADRIHPSSVVVVNNEDWQDIAPAEYTRLPHIDRVAFKPERGGLCVFTLPVASLNLFADPVVLDHLRIILTALEALRWDGKGQPAWAPEGLARLMGLFAA